MRIMISPAKKMIIDRDSLPLRGLPQFLSEAKVLQSFLQGMNYQQLKALWRCSDTIAVSHYEALKSMDLDACLTPAIFAYQGLQYQYMAPDIFEESQFDYIQEHLRILSGFYGLLKPFDGVVPYRLEMEAKLSVGECRNLYDFWHRKLAEQLCRETDFILNLASKEYSKAVAAYLPKSVFFLTCTFGTLSPYHPGKILEKGTLCKMARGKMVRYLTEQNITHREGIKYFHDLGYLYSEEHSTPENFVFLRNNDCK